jgi:hypothetical protein
MDDGTGRLHQFVRTLEAPVKPDIGNTRRQFAHRIDQTFTVANAETRETLTEIFDLRSRIASTSTTRSTSSPETVTHEWRRRIAGRGRSTCSLPSRPRGCSRTTTDAGVDAFWQLADPVRAAAWKQRLDLRTVV